MPFLRGHLVLIAPLKLSTLLSICWSNREGEGGKKTRLYGRLRESRILGPRSGDFEIMKILFVGSNDIIIKRAEPFDVTKPSPKIRLSSTAFRVEILLILYRWPIIGLEKSATMWRRHEFWV